VRLLLTSAGIRNESLRLALTDLAERPLGHAKVVFVVTAATAQAGHHDWLVADLNRCYDLGWDEFNVLDFNGIPRSAVLRRLRNADVIYVTGGNTYHLARSIADNNLADDILDLLDHKVYAGASAGSMIFTRSLTDRLTASYGTDDETYHDSGGRSVSPFDLFDWWIMPHVDFNGGSPLVARPVGCSYYALDDQSGVRVVEGHVDVVSEGAWTFVNEEAE
jgi:dipeptidase E